MDYIFNPTILECKRFITKNTPFSSERPIMDYEFDYYIDGDRKMYIDKKYYHVRKGSLVLRKPGQTVYSSGDYNCYILTLDFTGRIIEKYTRHNAPAVQELNDLPIWNVIPAVFVPYHREDYLRIFSELVSIIELDINKNERSQMLVNELLHLIVLDALIRQSEKNSVEADCIDDVCNYIKKHYMDNITLDRLSEIAHINKSHLSRKFKNRLGIPPIAYLIQSRMENAKQMLSETDFSIKEIASCIGYPDTSFFNYYFKKMLGMTPVQYRMLYKK